MRLASDSNNPLRVYLRTLLTAQGRKFDKCELCGSSRNIMLHHKRYNGATLADIVIVCAKCNLAKSNKGLE